MKTLYISVGILITQFFFNCSSSQAQLASDLDNSFGVNGIRVTDIAGADDWVYSLGLQSDNKIIAAGITNSGDIAVARYSSDGLLDLTFGTSGFQIINATTASVDDAQIQIQADDKIVVGGRFRNGTNMDFCAVRLNSNGNLDNTFGTAGKVTTDTGTNSDFANCIVLQPDGKIILAGQTGNGVNADFTLVRYNSDGTLDNTFGTSGIQINDFSVDGDGIEDIKLLSDGKIIAVGYAYTGAYNDFIVVRYNADGSLDNTFGTAGKTLIDYNNLSNTCTSVVIQSDGKIVVSGTHSGASSYDIMNVRLNSDGSLDNTFGTNGIVITTFGDDEKSHDITIQDNGKIIVVGERDNNMLLVRYNVDGSLDNTFGTGGNQVTDVPGGNYDKARAVLIQPDGKILVGGNTYTTFNEFVLARYHGDAISAGISEIIKSDISVYPNPFNDQFNIKLTKNYDQVELNIFDQTGKIVSKMKYTSTSNLNIDLDVEKGIYYIELKSKGESLLINKIIKQ